MRDPTLPALESVRLHARMSARYCVRSRCVRAGGGWGAAALKPVPACNPHACAHLPTHSFVKLAAQTRRVGLAIERRPPRTPAFFSACMPQGFPVGCSTCTDTAWRPLTSSTRQPRTMDRTHKFGGTAELVVAHCRRDLNWLRREVEELGHCGISTARVSIYSKCGVAPIGGPTTAELHTLPNVGREAHTFLTHIVNGWVERTSSASPRGQDAYDAPSLQLFLTDSYHTHEGRNDAMRVRLCDMAEAALTGPLEFGCALRPQANASAWHDGVWLRRFHLANYSVQWDQNYDPRPMHRRVSHSFAPPFAAPVQPLDRWLLAALRNATSRLTLPKGSASASQPRKDSQRESWRA